MNDLIHDVLSDLDHMINRTNARIQVDALPQIKGNPTQLRQLFQNLISNAIKFSSVDVLRSVQIPEIAIHHKFVKATDLPLGVEPVRLAVQYHRIDISDNGIGFDEKYLDRIFQVFQRLHNKSDFAGTGIGLAICEKVVTNHGGAITAASQQGFGATFSLYFPC